MLHKNIRAFLSNIGKVGGKASAAALTPEQRKERARRGGLARGENYRKKRDY